MNEQQAAGCLIHYLSALAKQSGLRWTNENSADIRAAVNALWQSDALPDSIPPFRTEQPTPQPQERVTINFQKEPGQVPDEVEDWRRRRHERDEEDTRRMLNRDRR